MKIYFEIGINRILTLLAVVIVSILLEYRYITFVVPDYSQFNFTYNFQMDRFVVGILLFVISLMFLLFKQTKYMYSIAVLFNVLMLVPNLILYQFTDAPIAISLLIMLMLFLLSTDIVKVPFFNKIGAKIPIIESDYLLPFLSILALLSVLPFMLAYGFKIDIRVFTFGSIIYDIRAAGNLLSNTFTRYLYSPLNNFLLPIIIIFGFMRKKWLYVVLGIVLMVYLYAIIPQKATFFGLISIVIFYFIKDIEVKIKYLVFGLLFILAATVVLTDYYGVIMPESIFVRRLFFLPAILNNAYFEIFKDNHIYLSHSIFKHFIDYPYELEPAFYVSEQFWGEYSSANNGIISDGYMNFGIIGSVVFLYVVVLMFKTIDLLNVSSRFFGISFIMIIVFISGALLTSLLTHGLLFLFVLLFLFLRNTQSANDEK